MRWLISNPYVGILTYLVAPAFLVMGMFLALLEAFLRRRQVLKTSGPLPPLRIDLTRPRDRKLLGFFLAGSVAFLLVSGPWAATKPTTLPNRSRSAARPATG